LTKPVQYIHRCLQTEDDLWQALGSQANHTQGAVKGTRGDNCPIAVIRVMMIY